MFEKIALLQARGLFRIGEPEWALERYNRLWQQTQDIRSLPGLVAGIEMTMILYQQGRASEAEPILLELLPWAEEFPSAAKRPVLLLKSYEVLALVSMAQKKFSEGRRYLQLGEDCLKKCRGRKMAVEYYEICTLFFEQAKDRDRALKAASLLSQYEGRDDALSRLLNGEQGTASDRMRTAYKAMERNEAENSDAVCRKLSEIYISLGEPRKALEFALQSLSLSRTRFGENSRQTADAYVLVAESCIIDGLQSEKAPSGSTGFLPEFHPGNMAFNYFHRALNILQKQKKEDPQRLSLVYQRLAMMYNFADDDDKAMEYGREAMLTASRAFPPDHPAVLDALEQLAVLYYDRKQYRKAYSYSQEVLKRRRGKASPEELTEYLWANILIGLPCGLMSDPQKLRDLMTALEREPNAIAWLPQEELRLQYLRQMSNQREFCYQMALHAKSACTADELYDFTLKTNNLDAQISYTQAHFFRFEAAPELRMAEARVRQLQRNLNEYFKENGTDDVRLQQLHRAVDDAQTELLRQMGGVKLPSVGTDISSSQVQAALSPQEAILEYGRFLWTEDLKAYKDGEGEDHYFGFCVTKDRIIFLDLGSAEKADQLVLGLNCAIKAEESCQPWLGQLYQFLVKPFEAELHEKQGLIIVPDSTLYKLSFELLTDGAQRFLRDTFPSIRYASSGRELLRHREEEAENPGISLIAAPQYDLSEEEKLPGEITEEHKRSVDMSDGLQAERIPQLPFTRVEAEEVAALFGEKASLFTGVRATKHSMEAQTQAKILHIATHGFAYEPQPRAPVGESLKNRQSRGRHLQQAEDPLLRCGLLFAGAGNWLRGEKLSDAYGDGILTGSDLLTMDLSKYRLLTLSACQTGLGDTQSGEGIKGLRHAFELAGVGSMVCTLWEVDDFASAILMRRFYEELLAEPAAGAACALARAKEFVRTLNGADLLKMGWQEHIMELHTLGAETKSGENYANYIMNREHPFAHPRYWAGYIIQE